MTLKSVPWGGAQPGVWVETMAPCSVRGEWPPEGQCRCSRPRSSRSRSVPGFVLRVWRWVGYVLREREGPIFGAPHSGAQVSSFSHKMTVVT